MSTSTGIFCSLIKSCCFANFSFAAARRALISSSSGFSIAFHSCSIKKSPFSYTFSSSIHISAIMFRRSTDLCLLLCCHSSFSFSQNFRNIKAFSHFLYFFQNLTVLFFCLYFRILVFFYKRFLSIIFFSLFFCINAGKQEKPPCNLYSYTI